MKVESSPDRAGRSYWDSLWAEQSIPEPVNPHRGGVSNYINRRFDAFFCDAFSCISTDDKRLIEVGCARSAWLPYFALEFGFVITGLDYSETGCKQEREVLAAAGVRGDVVCADLFQPPSHLRNAFDVVVSFGVLEHFNDPVAVAEALRRLAVPGGLIVTLIPNLAGLTGKVVRLVNRHVYELHNPLTIEDLHEAHTHAGLKVKACRYLISTNFGVANLNDLDARKPTTRTKAIMLRGLRGASKAAWALETALGPFPETKAFAPYVACVAERKVIAQTT